MNANQKVCIARMREKGMGYIQIAKEMDMSVNTVKTYCRRNGL